MSFVFAMKYKERIYMFGDTKITFDKDNIINNFGNDVRLIEQIGMLKTIILSDDIALGVAGNNIKLINNAIADICFRDITKTEILDILKDYTLRKDNPPDFVLAYKNETIYRISNGEVEERENCYIGSKDFFEELQKRRNNQPLCPSKISDKIRNLIKEEFDNTVGGYFTSVLYVKENKKFVYNLYLDSTVTNIGFVPSGGNLPLWDNAQNGGYTFQLLPYDMGFSVPFLAINFSQNNKTYLFVPRKIINDKDSYYNMLFLPYDFDNLPDT